MGQWWHCWGVLCLVQSWGGSQAQPGWTLLTSEDLVLSVWVRAHLGSVRTALLKESQFRRVSNHFPFCFLKEIFETHDDSNAVNSLLSSTIIMILIFLGPFLWFKTDWFQELKLDLLFCIKGEMTNTVFSVLCSHYCSFILKENNHETVVFLYCAWALLSMKCKLGAGLLVIFLRCLRYPFSWDIKCFKIFSSVTILSDFWVGTVNLGGKVLLFLIIKRNRLFYIIYLPPKGFGPLFF